MSYFHTPPIPSFQSFPIRHEAFLLTMIHYTLHCCISLFSYISIQVNISNTTNLLLFLQILFFRGLTVVGVGSASTECSGLPAKSELELSHHRRDLAETPMMSTSRKPVFGYIKSDLMSIFIFQWCSSSKRQPRNFPYRCRFLIEIFQNVRSLSLSLSL